MAVDGSNGNGQTEAPEPGFIKVTLGPEGNAILNTNLGDAIQRNGLWMAGLQILMNPTPVQEPSNILRPSFVPPRGIRG